MPTRSSRQTAPSAASTARPSTAGRTGGPGVGEGRIIMTMMMIIMIVMIITNN